VCASTINNTFYLNDDSKRVKIVSKMEVEKKVTLVSIKKKS
jgi:hypothetical protein